MVSSCDGLTMRSILVCLVAIVVGCGGSDSPVDKCDDLVDITCDRAIDCVAGAGTHAECVQEVQAVLPCGMAKSVTPSYARCISQMKSNTCAALFPGGQLDLPADCEGVILTARVAPGDVDPPTGPTSRGAVELTSEE
jgi:hypothetical protein